MFWFSRLLRWGSCLSYLQTQAQHSKMNNARRLGVDGSDLYLYLYCLRIYCCACLSRSLSLSLCLYSLSFDLSLYVYFHSCCRYLFEPQTFLVHVHSAIWSTLFFSSSIHLLHDFLPLFFCALMVGTWPWYCHHPPLGGTSSWEKIRNGCLRRSGVKSGLVVVEEAKPCLS